MADKEPMDPIRKSAFMNSAFFRWMAALGDVFLLGLVWLLACLPVVTAGAATCAAFAVGDKMAAQPDYRVWADFWAAFKRDWKPATRLWLVLAAAAGLIAAYYQAGFILSGVLGGVLIALAAALGVVWLLALGGCYALLGRFTYQKLLPLVRDGLRLSITNLGAALTWCGLLCFMPVLRLLVPDAFYYILPVWGLLGGGASIVIFARLLRPAFQRIEDALHKDLKL